jgi:hypothetical protein
VTHTPHPHYHDYVTRHHLLTGTSTKHSLSYHLTLSSHIPTLMETTSAVRYVRGQQQFLSNAAMRPPSPAVSPFNFAYVLVFLALLVSLLSSPLTSAQRITAIDGQRLLFFLFPLPSSTASLSSFSAPSPSPSSALCVPARVGCTSNREYYSPNRLLDCRAGNQLRLYGSALCNSASGVQVAVDGTSRYVCPITSWSATGVWCTFPDVQPVDFGRNLSVALRCANGTAAFSGVTSYGRLRLHDWSGCAAKDSQGRLVGCKAGDIVTLRGEGFGVAANASVTAYWGGLRVYLSTQPCALTVVSSALATCELPLLSSAGAFDVFMQLTVAVAYLPFDINVQLSYSWRPQITYVQGSATPPPPPAARTALGLLTQLRVCCAV